MYKHKKVLCMTRKYPPRVGGMERFCFDLYTLLEKEDALDVKIVALGKSQKNLFWFLPYCFFYLVFHAGKYDAIIFSDAMFAGCAWIAGIFSKKTKKITDIHGLDVMYPNPLYQIYMKLFLDKFDMYVCNSKNTETLVKSLGISNTVVINRGVHVYTPHVNVSKKEFCRQYGINESALLLITVGRLVKRKGVGWFVANVMPKLKDENVIYYVVGAGPEKENIQRVIDENKLNDKVKLLGEVSDARLSDLYLYADVFVMPNIPVINDVEGFGIVAIEASCKECIVVASNTDGIPDAVIDNQNGYLIDCQDADMFADKITDIIKNRDYYKNIAKEFSRYTKEKFSVESIEKQYLRLL